MAVAACATWLPPGGDRKSDQSAVTAPCAEPGQPAPKSLAELAGDAGVSRRTMAEAAKVVMQAGPRLPRQRRMVTSRASDNQPHHQPALRSPRSCPGKKVPLQNTHSTAESSPTTNTR